MTKNEIQVRYATLAAQVGDLYMRMQTAQASLKEMSTQMGELFKQRQDLEEQLKQATDE